MFSEPRSGRLAAWGNALLAGLVSPDDAVLAIVGEDAVHRMEGLPGESAQVGLTLGLIGGGGSILAVPLLVYVVGVTDLTEVLRWWPTVLEVLYLAPLALLLSAVRTGWRARWCAAWLFVLCGWVGQDYFSPQSLNYLLYLVFVAVLLVWFRPPRPDGGRLLPGEAKPRPAGRGDRAVLLGLLLAVFTASVVSHQLTPFVMLGVAAALVLWRRCTLRGLPLLCGVLVVSWVGFLAEPYWSGHFADLFGGIGSLGGNVTSSVSGRIQGGSDTHRLVLYARVLLAAGDTFRAAAIDHRTRR